MAKIKFNEYLTKQIALCGKSQIEISEEIGYTKPNIITMFKQGKTKVPIDKVESLAKAIGVDPAHMLMLAMTEYMPQTWEVIGSILGNIVSDNELEIVEFIRKNLEENVFDPKLRTAEQKQLLTCSARSFKQ